VDSSDFYLYADPLFEFGMGKDNYGRNTYINTRGFRAGGRLGNNFAFGTDFYENQGVFNTALTNQIKKSKVFPGEGMARQFGSNGFDYACSSGYLSVILMQKLNITLAQGRQFIGDGYRSLLLSDASYTYPYMRFIWQSNSFLYSWNNLLLQDNDVLIAAKTVPYRRKFATIHTIAYNLKNRIQLAVVKMQLYDNPDTFGKYTVDLNQLNPLIIPGNTDNQSHSLWGFNLKITPFRKFVLYNQWAIDNLFSDYTKRFAMQVGAKYYGSWRNNALYIQAEYNRVPSMAYSSANKILTWKHFKEPLAHPYGNNFEEALLIGKWTYKRWQVSGQANFAWKLKSIIDNKLIAQNTVSYYSPGNQLRWYKAELTFYINPKTLMNISLGYNFREESLAVGGNTMRYVYFSFGTRLFNGYYDY
jgi:hypothetical protein